MKAAETIAFTLCERDTTPGLTWEDVEKCMEKLKDHHSIPYNTTRNDFDESDLNGDGVLLFDEWMESVKNKIP